MDLSQGKLREELHGELLAVALNTHTSSRSLHRKIKFRLEKIRFKLYDTQNWRFVEMSRVSKCYEFITIIKKRLSLPHGICGRMTALSGEGSCVILRNL